MSKTFRRFEILLPLRFNDGRPVPDDLIGESLLELRHRFGAVSCETQTIRGIWEQHEQIFRDDLVRIFVDVAEETESRAFFKDFKERMKTRFEQLDIWITTYPIDVV